MLASSLSFPRLTVEYLTGKTVSSVTCQIHCALSIRLITEIQLHSVSSVTSFLSCVIFHESSTRSQLRGPTTSALTQGTVLRRNPNPLRTHTLPGWVFCSCHLEILNSFIS